MSGNVHDAANSDSSHAVLVVEDETLVSMLLEDMLADLGFGTVKVAARLNEALHAIENRKFSFAILDVDLAGQSSLPAADLLRKQKVPFFFSTGYGDDATAEHYANIATLRKPFRMAELKATIAGLALPDMPAKVYA